MRVLMFGWEFPPYNSGGLGVACYGLARALSKNNINLIFVLPRAMPVSLSGVQFVFADPSPISITHHTDTNYISAYAAPLKKHRVKIASLPNEQLFEGGLFDAVFRYALLSRPIALNNSFDVIHAHDWLTFPAAIEARRISGKPLVVHIHATEFDRTGQGTLNEGVYQIEKKGMEVADRVIAVSHYTRNTIINRYGIAPEKVEVVHNGIDQDDNAATTGVIRTIHAHAHSGKKIILFVGRLTLQKGPDYFIQAAKKVLEKNPAVMFVISGSGDMYEQLVQSAAHSGIASSVFYVGFLRGEQLAQMYQMASLVVMPSVSEPFGIVPLESLLNGTPVLMSKQSGVSEVVNHALKVDFWDTDAMAEKMLAVVRYPSLQKTLSHNGVREVQHLNWQKAAEKCIVVYNALIQTEKSSSL